MTTDIDAFKSLLTKVDAVPEELALLLLDDTLAKAAQCLATAADRAMGPDAASLVALSRNMLMFAHGTVSSVIERHKDWTSTGDTRVETLWREWIALLDSLRLSPDDLPADVAERLAKHEETEEDVALVKRIMAQKTGASEDDFILDNHARTKPDDGPKAEDVDLGTGGYL